MGQEQALVPAAPLAKEGAATALRQGCAAWHGRKERRTQLQPSEKRRNGQALFFTESLWLENRCLCVLKLEADCGESAKLLWVFLRLYSQSRGEESLAPCGCLHVFQYM